MVSKINKIKLNFPLRTILNLGLINCFKVLIYRTLIKSKILILISPIKKLNPPQLINKEKNNYKNNYDWFPNSVNENVKYADQICDGFYTFFNHSKIFITTKPNWHFDYEKQFNFDNKNHWSQISTFPNYDIKICWELSRWDWIIDLSLAWKITSSQKYLTKINYLMKSWSSANPFNKGSNWICAQEVSIRLIHFIQALNLIEGINKNERVLSFHNEEFIIKHLDRISLTKFYAEAQNNNHWTSEAAALFIGGNLIKYKGSIYTKKAEKYANLGRKNLEKSIKLLVMNDGSFAQNSINYHRLFLDTISQVELWRRRLNLKEFSQELKNKCDKATYWLENFIDKKSGDAPNLGANDGAYCYQLHNRVFRDFRYTLQLASTLFCKFSALPQGKWDEQLFLENLNPNYNIKKVKEFKNIKLFKDGGYIVATYPNSLALLRIAKYKFRPSNIDPLHFDLWYDGFNILRDGGSYSYNTSNKLFNYFFGIKSHNSVEFDNSEPMPKISRFLCTNWLNSKNYKIKSNRYLCSIQSNYKNSNGLHSRKIISKDNGLYWEIIDYLDNFSKIATLRWRLIKSNWKLNKNNIISEKYNIFITCNIENFKLQLIEEWESKFYNQKELIPVLLMKIYECPVKIKTVIKINI